MKIKFVVGCVLSLVAIAMAGCPLSFDYSWYGPNPWNNPNPNPIEDNSLTIYNGSYYSIIDIRVAMCSDTDWGPNLIGNDVYSGNYITFTNIADGCYDVLTEDSSGYVFEQYDIYLYGNEDYQVNIVGYDQPVVGNNSITIYNASSYDPIFDIRIFHCMEDVFLGPNQLGYEVINPGGSFTFVGVADGCYGVYIEQFDYGVTFFSEVFVYDDIDYVISIGKKGAEIPDKF